MTKDEAHYELEMVRRYIEKRRETDQEIPEWLPLLGFIFVLAGLLFMLGFLLTAPGWGAPQIVPFSLTLFFTGMAVVVLGAIIGALIFLYLVYIWLERINKHFDRVRNLYRNLALYLEKKGYQDLSRWIDNEVREMEYKMSGERSPVLWAILVFIINILIWYVLHMVNDSLRKLGTSEHNILARLDKEIRDGGLEGLGVAVEEIGKIEKRDTIVYIILSIITLGLFTIYWAYVATKDINKHFHDHRMIEDRLLSTIEKL